MTGRLLGVLLIGAVSLYTGGAFVSLWQRRVEQLAAFCRLLGALEDGIGVMGLSVGEILGQFSDDTLEKTGFLPLVRRILDDNPTGDAPGDAFAVCRPRLALEDEDCALLRQFFVRIGTEDRVREQERCAYVRARLHTLCTEAESALPARCRIARTLAGAFGCAAALMLL